MSASKRRFPGFLACLFTAAAAWPTLPVLGAENPNSLSTEEKDAGFELLFNGTSLDDWGQSGNWEVVGGAIARVGKGGSLTYSAKKVPDDFEVRFEWKVAEGSNSGVYYRPGQYEYQILDNGVHRDGHNPRTSAASLYFCIAPSRDATRPVGQWNTARIVAKGTVIQHWLNGEKVIHFDYADPKHAEDVERLRIRGADLAARGSHLFLQDHGDPVWYRGIKMRALEKDEVLDQTPVEPEAIPPEVLRIEREKLEQFRKRNEAAQKAKAS
ncbi:MAG: DUF1080 domain-containing protein [Planctomycetota bacterium]